jgi:phospholipid-binding lipoprotein MlaA
MPNRTFRALLLVAVAILAGCASLPPGKRDPRDRFERLNRAVFSFNQEVDRGIARPVAKAYVKVTPAPVRSGVANFLANLNYPVTAVNDLLQAKPVAFGKDVARLVVNTTIGIGGLFDPASKMGLEANEEDFGQTLGRWGVPSGPYLVLPLLGPSDVRDALGKVADHYTEPKTYLNDQKISWGLTGLDLLDTRAATLEAADVINRAFDPYAFMRNAYLQRRQFLIYDGNPPEEPLSEDGDDAADEASSAQK